MLPLSRKDPVGGSCGEVSPTLLFFAAVGPAAATVAALVAPAALFFDLLLLLLLLLPLLLFPLRFVFLLLFVALSCDAPDMARLLLPTEATGEALERAGLLGRAYGGWAEEGGWWAEDLFREEEEDSVDKGMNASPDALDAADPLVAAAAAAAAPDRSECRPDGVIIGPVSAEFPARFTLFRISALVNMALYNAVVALASTSMCLAIFRVSNTRLCVASAM